MSTPADQLGAAAPPGAPPPEGGEPAPAAADTMTPQEPKGEQASASAAVQVARRMLEHSLVAYGADSKEGKAIMKAIHAITGAFAMKEDEGNQLMPAELKTALTAPAGEPGPIGAAA
jgi:hypothetical protein